MRKYLYLLLLGLFFHTGMQGQTYKYGLSGTFEAPDGRPLNGTITIQLVKPTVINTCASSYQIVPLSVQPAVLQIVNGVIQGANGNYSVSVNNAIVAAINNLFGVNGSTVSGSNAILAANSSVVGSGNGSLQLLSNDCMSPKIPYYIQINDSHNNLIYSDNWYIPKVSNTNVDVGTFGEVSFGGPIVVAIPSAVVQSPAIGQTIVQPGSTYLSVNNLVVTNSFIATNTIAGNISGNSATANALATVPSQCNTGYFSTGITANGTANCSNAFPSNSVYNTLQWTGGTNSYSNQGGYLNWNLTGGVGETDFVNAEGAGSGGFNWYNIADGGTPSSALMSLTPNSGGTLSVPVVSIGTQISSPVFVGPLSGNANTATSLAHTPTQCSTSAMTGINANGNANCATGTDILSSNGYHIFESGLIAEWGVTGDLGGGTITVSFPLTFPHTCFSVVATTYASTDRITWIDSWTSSYFQVSSNGTSSSATWIAYGY